MKVLCPKSSIHSFLHCNITELTDKAVAAQQWPVHKTERLRAEWGPFDVLFVGGIDTVLTEIRARGEKV